jgi:hypothetical protein
VSLRPVALSFLPVDPIPNGKLNCRSGGLTVVAVVLTGVKIDPVL